MLGLDHSGGYPRRKLCSLFDLSSVGFDNHPVAFADAESASCLWIDFSCWVWIETT